jgi:hypothetical protein
MAVARTNKQKMRTVVEGGLQPPAKTVRNIFGF